MSVTAVVLSLMLALSQPWTASAQAPSQEAGSAPKLNLIIVEGDGAINNIRQRTAREPIVQVEDQNHKPVAGAVVVFLLPDHGASGVFAHGSHTLTVVSDAQGRAVARGLKPHRRRKSMKTLQATWLTCLLLAVPLAALAASLEGPRLGLIFDSGAKEFRPLLGIPGAATMGAPLRLTVEIERAWVAPGQDYALAVEKGDGKVLLISLKNGGVSAVSV